MDKNRRRYSRKVPDDFAFIQIERDEIGKVLNISKGGLSFASFAPIPQIGPLYFWFSLNLKDRIEGMGEVAWMDTTGKLGGLKFTQLSKSGSQQIQQWLSRPPAKPILPEEPVPQVAPRKEPIKIRAAGPDRVARFVSKARASQAPLSLNISPAKAVDSPSSTVPRPGGFVPVERYYSAKRRQLFLGVLLGLGISVALATPLFVYRLYNRHASKTEPVSAEVTSPKTDVRAQDSGAASLPAAKPTAPGDVFASSAQSKGTVSASNPGKKVAASYEQTQPQRTGFGAPRESATMPGPLQASGGMNPSKSKKLLTPAELWASVQAGDTKAAVELAELYIKGDGVAKNCQQARVLLLIASEKKNAAAIKRLQELDKDPTTCP